MDNTSMAQELAYEPDSNALIELLLLEPEPSDEETRLEWLRIMAKSEIVKLDRCPECDAELADRDIIAHAQNHYPLHVPRALMSKEALEREAALYRAADQEPPHR